jgi:hypothetical protein
MLIHNVQCIQIAFDGKQLLTTREAHHDLYSVSTWDCDPLSSRKDSFSKPNATTLYSAELGFEFVALVRRSANLL